METYWLLGLATFIVVVFVPLSVWLTVYLVTTRDDFEGEIKGPLFSIRGAARGRKRRR